MSSYVYDVAFSFLVQDEALAERLHNLVSKSLKSFLYSQRQREIVGTDGEVTLNRVYGEQARVVVVLYRGAWGETPFTRIEATAIRNRAFSDGYDFVLMIPLDEPPTAPKWMPKPRLWCDLARLGEEEAVAIIKERVRAAGGEARSETPEENLARLARDVNAERKRRGTLSSEAGVKMALAEVDNLLGEFDRIVAVSRQSGHPFETERNPQDRRMLFVRGGGVTALVIWEQEYLNTLNHSGLVVRYTSGDLRFVAPQPQRPTRELEVVTYTFDLTPGLQGIWRSKGRRDGVSMKQLVDEIIRALTEHVRRQHRI